MVAQNEIPRGERSPASRLDARVRGPKKEKKKFPAALASKNRSVGETKRLILQQTNPRLEKR